MSHYFAIVVTEKTDDPRAAVEIAMAPHREQYDEITEESSGWWDWYRIGGRWDGVLLTDRKTWEESECSGCIAEPIRHHYTDAHEQIVNNCIPVPQLPEDIHCYRIVFPDGSTISASHWDNCEECGKYRDGAMSYEEYKALGHPYDDPESIWIPKMRRALVGYHDCLAVAVDYHN